jgi:hypothetical protein
VLDQRGKGICNTALVGHKAAAIEPADFGTWVSTLQGLFYAAGNAASAVVAAALSTRT